MTTAITAAEAVAITMGAIAVTIRSSETDSLVSCSFEMRRRGQLGMSRLPMHME